MTSELLSGNCPAAEAALDSLFGKLWNPINDTDQPKDPFHYTSAPGLHGILTTKTFWAADVFCLNDPSEFYYGKSILMEVLRARTDSVSQSLLGGFEEHELFPHLGRNWAVYVVCFCAVPDLLGQWRGYSGPGGYAIEIDFQKVLRDKSTNFTLLRMLYHPDHQRRLLSELIVGSVDIFENYRKIGNEEYLITK